MYSKAFDCLTCLSASSPRLCRALVTPACRACSHLPKGHGSTTRIKSNEFTTCTTQWLKTYWKSHGIASSCSSCSVVRVWMCVCVVVCCLWCSYFLCVCCCLDTAILIALRLSLHRNTTNTIDSKAIDKEYPIHTSDAWPSMRKQLHGVLAVPPNRHGSPNHLHLKLEINHNLVLMC